MSSPKLLNTIGTRICVIALLIIKWVSLLLVRLPPLRDLPNCLARFSIYKPGFHGKEYLLQANYRNIKGYIPEFLQLVEQPTLRLPR
jgi:hypothetical protein